MTGLVIVSHSRKLADGIKELICQMGIINVSVAAAGGTKDGRLGTDAEDIESAINDVFSKNGVLIFYDLGSALLSTEMAVENLPEYMREKVYIMHAPVVEGAFIAAVDISINKEISDIEFELKNMKPDKSKW